MKEEILAPKRRHPEWTNYAIAKQLGCDRSSVRYCLNPEFRKRKDRNNSLQCRLLKEMLVESHGGCCTRCGYYACIEALEFHHLDPSVKQFHVTQSRISAVRALEESLKCQLLCANCHREIKFNISLGS